MNDQVTVTVIPVDVTIVHAEHPASEPVRQTRYVYLAVFADDKARYAATGEGQDVGGAVASLYTDYQIRVEDEENADDTPGLMMSDIHYPANSFSHHAGYQEGLRQGHLDAYMGVLGPCPECTVPAPEFPHMSRCPNRRRG